MDYMTPQETAERWKIGLRRVQYLCSTGRIPGVIRVGRQWMIPLDAQRPADERNRSVKKTSCQEPYHFPQLLYSSCYFSPSSLSEDERTLLEAQKLYLQGKKTESITLSRQLIEDTLSDSVKFGACYTNALNFQLLGLFTEYTASVNILEEICSRTTQYKEDYRFLLAELHFWETFDSSAVTEINTAELSLDALIYYECIAASAAVLSGEEVRPSDIRLFSGFLRRCELLGIVPAQIMLRCCLSKLCSRSGDTEGHIKYIESVCRLCHEHDYRVLLTKSSALTPDVYHTCLGKYGTKFVNEIETARAVNAKNWRFVRDCRTGGIPFFVGSAYESEYVLLLSYGMTVSEIAALKNVTQQEVQEMIRKLNVRTNTKTKKELVAYCKKLFHNE